MQNYIVSFSDYLKTERHSSRNTLESYLRDVQQFDSHLAAMSLEFSDCTTLVIDKYIGALRASGKSYATSSRVVASLRCFFGFLKLQDIVIDNPLDGYKLSHEEKKLPEVLTNNEVVKLLSQPDGSDYKSCRDKAMLELLYATGIKVSELIDLKVNDLNLQIGILHIRSVKSERIIPIYPAAIRALNHYLTSVRSAIVVDRDEERLFTNMNGLPLTRQGFWKIVKHYADSAGIEKEITPHTLRHSFAANLLENGAQLKDIKEMLGHSDISSTQIYAQIMKNKYTQAYKRFHPMAR